MNQIVETSQCVGCAACHDTCTHKAISMQIDAEGFPYPQIDQRLCVDCGLCQKVCPALNLIENPNGVDSHPLAYAAINKDEAVRQKSSSGGIFSALAVQTISQNGIVFGSALNNQLDLECVGVETLSELESLYGSKYFQSSMGSAYEKAKQHLKTGQKVLFCGTPCQIAGLYGFLGSPKKYTNLLTVDVVCHGVPSPKVFHKYISEMKSINKGKVKSINFRDKISGWKSFSITNVMEYDFSGSHFQTETILHRENIFMQAFLKNVCLRPSCHICHYAKLPRIADISLSDYWGVHNIHPEMDDDKGTSLVLINSLYGREAWQKIISNVSCKETDLSVAMQYNPCIVHPTKLNKNRSGFFTELDSAPLADLVKKYCKKPSLLYRFGAKVKRKLKKVFADFMFHHNYGIPL